MSKTTLEIIQDYGGGPIKITIDDIVSFTEIKKCQHIFVQGTFIFDDRTEVGDPVCIKCGEKK